MSNFQSVPKINSSNVEKVEKCWSFLELYENPLKKMLEFESSIPEEFRRNSRGKHLESLWNFDGIPLEYHWNTAADFVQIYRMFSRIIPMKYHSFFGGKNRNSYGIFVVFWWNFCGIF